MLESLTIRNYAIIDETTVEFAPGLNVITGETGAGKSIVVDALELVLGARASSDLIRAGTDTLEVTGVFTGVAGIGLEDVPPESGEDMLILRREVRADGRNRCYINDRPATLQTLKAAGDLLVDLHGQHEHQSLLDSREHIRYLDTYAGLDAEVEETAELYERIRALRADIDDIRRRIQDGDRERDLYEFQLREIDDAALQPDEDDELSSTLGRLSNAVELKTLANRIFEECAEAEGSVADRLGEFSHQLGDFAGIDRSLEPMADKCAELSAAAADVADFFRSYADNIEDDPGLLAETEERLAVVERLKKKYGPALKDVLAYRGEIAAKLEESSGADERLAEYERELAETEQRFGEKAAGLRDRRRDAAPGLASEVESHLAELGMEGARLTIDIRDCSGGTVLAGGEGERPVCRRGYDDVVFLISSNVGEPPRPLAKIASGGEISRIMLALKLALNETHLVPTMIFDEIDVGVSGKVAESMGRKLAVAAENRQALVITHLAQIAARGDRHFAARKQARGDRTVAGLVPLDDTARERELASLLAGEEVTDTAVSHARELLRSAGKR